MSVTIQTINAEYSTCPQISVDDIDEIAQLGFKTIINNRPDLEGGADQPLSDALKAKAESVGLAYFYIPVVPNAIQANEVDAFTKAYANAPKPILGFCRTGNRASKMLALSQSQQSQQ